MPLYPQSPYQQPYEQPARPTNWLKIILIILGIIVLILVVVFVIIPAFFGEKSGGEELNNNNAPTYDCSSDVYNCADFETQADAQAVFDYCSDQGAGDVHRLDADGNGEACESLG